MGTSISFCEKNYNAWVHRLGKLIARVKALEKKLGL